ncbi:hypothetical protein Cgig2_016087 [Carnegiea gigantea]|uniref:Uncharacterized protein n=1 Tax=Carnegiea gigantea TaxID=171969 RepID=A0A9Q1GWL6_9CARY|nr:hypothetical protein Cgig2_016087 [Carnegiea gigantea]
MQRPELSVAAGEVLAGDLSPVTFPVTGELPEFQFTAFFFSEVDVCRAIGLVMREGCKRFVAIESKSFDLTIVGTAEDVLKISENGRHMQLDRGKQRVIKEPDALLVCDTSSSSTDEAKCVDPALYEARICGQAASNWFAPSAKDAVVSHQVPRGSLVLDIHPIQIP